MSHKNFFLFKLSLHLANDLKEYPKSIAAGFIKSAFQSQEDGYSDASTTR
jgi:hypothetical protein